MTVKAQLTELNQKIVHVWQHLLYIDFMVTTKFSEF